MKTDNAKGYFFAILATVAYSQVYIFSKAALNELPLALFGSLWYLVVTVLCVAFAAWNKQLELIKLLSKKQIMVLIVLGFLEIATTFLFFLSIHIIPDPSVTSFLGNMYPVFVMAGGIFILNEKFGTGGILGAFLALAGAFIISYSGGTSLQTLFIKGTGIVFLNAIFATTATLVVKVHVKNISPELFNLNRSVWLLSFAGIMLLVLNEPVTVSINSLKNILLGATLEFTAILTIYYSFRFIDVSKSSVVQSLKGIFVLLGAYIFLGTFPLKHQFIGGMISIAGVLLMTLSQTATFKKTAQKRLQ